MSINIKEIFQSDSLLVTQDKINYNFDQVLANGGGPEGLKGEKGSTGAIGSVGNTGPKGEKGEIGSKGEEGSSGYWTLDLATGVYDNNTVIPKLDSFGTGAIKPTNIVVGVDDSSYTSDPIDKNALISLINGNSGGDFSDMIRLRLFDGVDYSDSSFAIRLLPTTAGVHFKLLALGTDNIAEIQSEEIRLTDKNNITRIKITDANTEIVSDVNFVGSDVVLNTASTLTNNGATSLLGDNTVGATGKTSIVTGTVRITPTGSTPANNKILTATNANGSVAWKNPYEVLGIYPQGTIVFVNPTDITSDYFALSTYIFQNASISYQYYGRGQANTRWAGWYLLFGQTNLWQGFGPGGATTFSRIPVNVPGSLIMGASGPSGLVTGDYDSSMGIDTFRPPLGYGSSYTPSVRGGGFSGSGSTSPNFDPGDIVKSFDAASPGSNYDILGYGSLEDATGVSLVPSGNTGYPENPAIMPLPMAIYLGRTDLFYNYNEISA